MSILLLDVENMRLDSKIEQFLAKNCQYPLQIRLAFANWKTPNLSKCDSELHERGYQLIHVPEGKDSADGKMIAVGSSIFLQYPTVKEVFVCSNDTIFTNLCIDLENKGLTVYRLRKEGTNLVLENRQTGEMNYYCLDLEAEIPNDREIYLKLQALMNLEDKNLKERLIQLEQLATLFQERFKLIDKSSNSSNTNNHLTRENGSRASENKSNSNGNGKIDFTSKAILETEIINIIQLLCHKSHQKSIPISHVATQFKLQYNLSITEVMRGLKISHKFSKFLQESPYLELTQQGKIYYVELKTVNL
nr:NYN domain-containing protein [Gloeothece citriformis]